MAINKTAMQPAVDQSRMHEGFSASHEECVPGLRRVPGGSAITCMAQTQANLCGANSAIGMHAADDPSFTLLAVTKFPFSCLEYSCAECKENNPGEGVLAAANRSAANPGPYGAKLSHFRV
jgi:hypothetical protein